MRYGIYLFFSYLIAMICNFFVITLLWNMLMPKLFGLPEISFIEAIALYYLISTLSGRPVFRVNPMNNNIDEK